MSLVISHFLTSAALTLLTYAYTMSGVCLLEWRRRWEEEKGGKIGILEVGDHYRIDNFASIEVVTTQPTKALGFLFEKTVAYLVPNSYEKQGMGLRVHQDYRHL